MSVRIKVGDRGEGSLFLRGRIWWVSYYYQGKEVRESSGETDEGKARKYLSRCIRYVRNDTDGIRAFIEPSKTKRVTVNDLLDSLAADYRRRRKDTGCQFQSNIRVLREVFGHRRAMEVSSTAVNNFIDSLLEDGRRPATVNRKTQLLKQSYKLAVEEKVLAEHQVPRIRNLSEKGNERQGFFSKAEFETVVEHLPEHLQDFARFGFATGWRKGEIRSIQWTDVDDEYVCLRGEYSKNREPRRVPIDGELIGIMERRKAARVLVNDDGTSELASHVFHQTGRPLSGEHRREWISACIAAGVGEMVCKGCQQPTTRATCPKCGVATTYHGKLFHDLRRSAVKDMTDAGVSQKDAMVISGHKTVQVFLRYKISSAENQRSALRRTQEYRAAAAASGSDKVQPAVAMQPKADKRA